MANRIIFGEHQGDFKLRISKPGVNAETASRYDLLLSTEDRPFQIIASGQVDLSGNGPPANFDKTVIIPNQGFRPIILAAMYHTLSQFSASVDINYIDNTTVVIGRSRTDVNYSATGLFCRYFITTVPLE